MRGDRVTFRGAAHVDMPLLLVVMAIITLGLVNLYRATSVYIESERQARLADIYVKQIYWVVVGTMLAILAEAIDYRYFERLAMLVYFGGLVALGLVVILGGDIRGARRWIEIGSFQFQPSEFMKIVVILVVARILHNDPKTEPRTLLDLATPALAVAVPAAAVMAQPDLGTALILILTACSMIAMTKIKRASLITLIAAVGTAVPLAWHYVLRPYQKARITSFMNPELDKTGTGWGRGDALYACEARRGNCTDFHALVIGMARSVGIPARFAIGLPLPPGRGTGEVAGYHCWAELYVAGRGWVPAPPAWPPEPLVPAVIVPPLPLPLPPPSPPLPAALPPPRPPVCPPLPPLPALPAASPPALPARPPLPAVVPGPGPPGAPVHAASANKPIVTARQTFIHSIAAARARLFIRIRDAR